VRQHLQPRADERCEMAGRRTGWCGGMEEMNFGVRNTLPEHSVRYSASALSEEATDSDLPQIRVTGVKSA